MRGNGLKLCRGGGGVGGVGGRLSTVSPPTASTVQSNPSFAQRYPSASPALPVSPEGPITVHHSTPVTGLFPLGPTLS
ncbi:hypothetical protein QYF61_005419 [Mycteria americana]|uniref:Uncharacterized protein n=1 Tax=Mycteria americana TaxID=33587 RepID=A0AAN7S246_MYCAM|nr:hypothetical protein QYF61_005419 [Mycteria americana]